MIKFDQIYFNALNFERPVGSYSLFRNKKAPDIIAFLNKELDNIERLLTYNVYFEADGRNAALSGVEKIRSDLDFIEREVKDKENIYVKFDLLTLEIEINRLLSGVLDSLILERVNTNSRELYYFQHKLKDFNKRLEKLENK